MADLVDRSYRVVALKRNGVSARSQACLRQFKNYDHGVRGVSPSSYTLIRETVGVVSQLIGTSSRYTCGAIPLSALEIPSLG